MRYLRNDDFEPTGPTLQQTNGDWYLHVRTTADVDGSDSAAEHQTVLGVDLNATGHLAVTSTGVFCGKADHLNHVRMQYERRRASLHQTGTESAHRTIAPIGQRFAHWSDDLLHRTARAFVDEAIDHDCGVIALERLDYSRYRIADGATFQQWADRTLTEYIAYKAAGAGIALKTVHPAYTSQTCSRCEHTHEDNRDGDRFTCQDCDYAVHADYNAAKNIAIAYARAVRTSQDGHPVTVP